MTPITKKLQIKRGKRWLFYNAPTNYLATLEPLPDGVEAVFMIAGSFDGIQLFVKNNTDLVENLKIIKPLLKPDTIFWITYPKKSSALKQTWR
jgi:hypothetical protein